MQHMLRFGIWLLSPPYLYDVPQSHDCGESLPRILCLQDAMLSTLLCSHQKYNICISYLARSHCSQPAVQRQVKTSAIIQGGLQTTIAAAFARLVSQRSLLRGNQR